MFRRLVIAATIVAIGTAASSQTQTPSGGNQPTPSPQQPTTGQPSTPVQRKDIYWIGPKKQPEPKKPAQQDKSGRLVPRDLLKMSRTSSGDPPSAMSYIRVADRREMNAGRAASDAGILPTWSPAQPNGNIRLAQELQGPRINYYLIQFKAGVTKQQRDALLAKYGLTIARANEAFNIYVVTKPADRIENPTPFEAFNPPIVQALRREPLVQSVSVDSPARTRAVPKSSSLKIKDQHGVTYQWDWKSYAVAAPTPTDLTAAARPKTLDGNWGLKALRMPPVWTIVQRFRASSPKPPQPKLAIIDTGFSRHDNLKNMDLLPTPNIDGATSDLASGAKMKGDPCRVSHGNHVAGIAGATFGEGVGIDGIIPDSKMDAVPVSDNLMSDDAVSGSLEENLDRRSAYFSEVLFAVMSYVDGERTKSNELRVVNISMDLNIGDYVAAGYSLDEIKAALKDTLRAQAQMFIPLAAKYEKAVLIVTAAGNDSAMLDTPLEAKWASSLVWLAKANRDEIDRGLKRPRNLLVVEAVDRSGQRADFSNVSGDIAAPGVDILSTLAKGDAPYGLCDGTSMASPHAAAVAAILFELAPDKTPEQIIDIMVKSATAKPAGAIGAPRLDALEAVLRLSPFADGRNDNLRRLVDLNGDGKVDAADMKEFARRLAIVTENRTNGTPFAEDLNGDKVADLNECNSPVIDFNGSGVASLAHNDAKLVLGEYRNDLAIMQMAWTDKSKDPATAMKETGLDAAILAADKINPVVSAQACR